MVRAAAKNHPSVAVVVVAGALPDGPRPRSRPAGFTLRAAAGAGRRGLPPHGDLRRRGGVLDGRVVAPSDDGDRFPAWVGATWERADVLRYGENPHQRAALYVERRSRHAPGSRRPSSCTARRCPTTTTSTPTRPGGRPTTTREPGGRDHQARQPLRHRGRSRRRRGAPARRTTRPGLRLRRSHRDQPSGDGSDGRAGRRDLHRGRGGARLRRRRGGDPARRRRTCGCWSRPVSRAAAASRSVRSSGGLLMQSVDLVDAPGDDPAAWTLACGEAADASTLRRPGLRLAGLPLGEEQRDPAGPRRRDGRCRHGPGQPRRLGAAGGGPGRRGPGAGCGRRVRRLLPVPRRARGAHRGRCACGRAARAAPCGTTRSSQPPTPPGSPCTSPGRGTSSTEVRGRMGRVDVVADRGPGSSAQLNAGAALGAAWTARSSRDFVAALEPVNATGRRGRPASSGGCRTTPATRRRCGPGGTT